MTAEEWAAVLDAQARVARLEDHHTGRAHRDGRGLKLAREAARSLRIVISLAAPSTPVLGHPGRREWVSTAEAAAVLGISKRAALKRAKRGEVRGTGRRAGRRWDLHLPSQPELQR